MSKQYFSEKLDNVGECWDGEYESSPDGSETYKRYKMTITESVRHGATLCFCPECEAPWDKKHERCTANCQTGN